MNKEQEAYIKGVAHSIEVYATQMLLCVQALQRNSLHDMPTNLIDANFGDVITANHSIDEILDDLIPQLPDNDLEVGDLVRLKNTPHTGIIRAITPTNDNQILYSIAMSREAKQAGCEPIETVSQDQIEYYSIKLSGMPEEEDNTIVIIGTMIPSDHPPTDPATGLQLTDEQE